MYGMIPKPRGIFGRSPKGILPGDQPEIDLGDFPMGMARPQPGAPKGGFLAPGGAGRAIAGTIGDVLLQHNDLAPIYAPTMQLQQQMQAEEQQRQRERMEGREDKRWEWANKPPPTPNNDTVADYDFIMRTLGPKKAQEYLENKANPPVWRQGADGAFYRVDTQPNRPAVGTVVPDPRKQGGPASQAPGNFRP